MLARLRGRPDGDRRRRVEDQRDNWCRRTDAGSVGDLDGWDAAEAGTDNLSPGSSRGSDPLTLWHRSRAGGWSAVIASVAPLREAR
jgi:hypothetical protein